MIHLSAMPEFQTCMLFVLASLIAWVSEKRRGVWLKIPIEKSELIPVAVKVCVCGCNADVNVYVYLRCGMELHHYC